MLQWKACGCMFSTPFGLFFVGLDPREEENGTCYGTIDKDLEPPLDLKQLLKSMALQ